MKLKVKNTTGKDITIKLLDKTPYKLKNGEELILGNYSDDLKSYIFELLKKDLYVCKTIDDVEPNIKKDDNNIKKETKTPTKRGRPRKNNK